MTPTTPMMMRPVQRMSVLTGAMRRLAWMKPKRPKQVPIIEGMRLPMPPMPKPTKKAQSTVMGREPLLKIMSSRDTMYQQP